MYLVYIDRPDGFGDYIYLPGEKVGDDIVSRELGLSAKFVCNSYAKISRGDVYEIRFETKEDAIIFILGCRFNIVPNHLVEKYKK